MNTKLITIIIALLLLIGGAFFLITTQAPKQAQLKNSSFTASQEVPSTPPAKEAVTVTLTKSGFEPAKVSIRKGQRIIWLNKSGDTATVNSSDHPSHKDYSPLNLGEFPDGGKVELEFTQTGTYQYHDHYRSTHFGEIIVE